MGGHSAMACAWPVSVCPCPLPLPPLSPAQLGDQFMDVIIRVKAIRDFGIRCMCTILASSDILMESLDIERSNMYEVLSAAAWLCGEFCDRVCVRAAWPFFSPCLLAPIRPPLHPHPCPCPWPLLPPGPC